MFVNPSGGGFTVSPPIKKLKKGEKGSNNKLDKKIIK
jgi:hypothetical protein